MNHTNESKKFPIAEGTVSFMNKANNQWAIKYDERYYPFEPRKCIGWKKTFDSLKKGDRIYFPLLPRYDENHLLLAHISPLKKEVLKIKPSEFAEENFEITCWLLIPGLS